MRLAREHIETAKRAFDELGIGKTRDIKPPQDDVPPYTEIPDWVNDGTGDDHVDLEHHAEAAATRAQNTSTGKTEKPKSKTPAIYATPYAWKDPTKITLRDWLYGFILIRKFVTATVSPGAVGKSSLLTAEVLAMVSRKAILGIQPKKQLRVWL